MALQSCLDNLEEWAEQWGMSFNIAKCKVMHTGRGNPATVYTMSGRPLTVTEREKDIGVKVQCNLRPTAQCAEAAQIANAVFGQISRTFHYRDRHTFHKLYMQYVRPHLEFAAPAWSPWTQRDIDLLESVQQRAVRMISGLQATSYAGRLAELGMLSLQQRRILSDMVQVYKIVHGLDRVDKSTWFDLAGDSDVRITRATSDPLTHGTVCQQTLKEPLVCRRLEGALLTFYQTICSDARCQHKQYKREETSTRVLAPTGSTTLLPWCLYMRPVESTIQVTSK